MGAAEALKLLQKCEALCARTQDARYTCYVVWNLGRAHLALDDYDQAIAYLERALDSVAADIGIMKIEVHILISLGQAHLLLHRKSRGRRSGQLIAKVSAPPTRTPAPRTRLPQHHLH